MVNHFGNIVGDSGSGCWKRRCGITEVFVMSTENIDPNYTDLDSRPVADMMSAMCGNQRGALEAVQAAIPQITLATKAAYHALGETGRIVYVGAGTSIRVAVQDGSELPPTFNWPPARLEFVIAGGERALIEAQEGAEDNIADAHEQIDRLGLDACDVVIGVAASGATPFTVAALARAAQCNAVTIGVANNPNTPLLTTARYPVLLATGSELIAGSTRMKAGTSQKIVLNMISTGIMMQLGRVYCGMMVDMRVSNKKLTKRAAHMVARITGCDLCKARSAVEKAGGDIKVAALIASGYGKRAAGKLLKQSKGNLRTALG